MNVTFRQLRLLEAVARHSSFTRASEELHLTQPAVSTQIKQLEEEVGMPLFEQMGKKIFLTEVGKEVYAFSRAIAQQFRDIESVLDDMKGVKRGTLALTVTSTGKYFAPYLLAAFLKRHPGTQVHLEVTNREEVVQQLQDNTPDMAIMQEEIFGPLLPIIGYRDAAEPVSYINRHDRPLALYWFGKDDAARDEVLARTVSGGVTVNDCLFHFTQINQPMGGVGASGTGAYHGEWGFRSLSQLKPVFYRSPFNRLADLYPPYGAKVARLEKLLRWMS